MPPDDERDFFDSIRSTPDDDGPRLIFADWLDEHGESDRAEFVRISALWTACPMTTHDGLNSANANDNCRERNEVRWTASLRPLVTACAFHRGVIDSVSVDAAQFLANGPAIFDLAPIRKVRFFEVGAVQSRHGVAALASRAANSTCRPTRSATKGRCFSRGRRTSPSSTHSTSVSPTWAPTA